MNEEHRVLLSECAELRRMLTATCKTAKGINVHKPDTE
jgi:hypothetical protein